MKGITRGIQLIGLAINMYRRARRKGNIEAQTVLMGVFAELATEVFGTSDDAATDVKISIGNLLFGFGGDPFSGSRKMFQDAQARFPGL